MHRQIFSFLFIYSLNSLEGLNKTTFLSFIIFSSLVLGFLPRRLFLDLIENVPNLLIFDEDLILKFKCIANINILKNEHKLSVENWIDTGGLELLNNINSKPVSMPAKESVNVLREGNKILETGQGDAKQLLKNMVSDDPENFEQVSSQISSVINDIATAVQPEVSDSYLDGVIQEVFKAVEDKKTELDKQIKEKDSKVSKKKKK